ncbi:MAG: M48 family metalloprotease [Chloroflexi bacterium]|nr:M48 family metalloprotease [Chloroflexota bacterium]
MKARLILTILAAFLFLTFTSVFGMVSFQTEVNIGKELSQELEKQYRVTTDTRVSSLGAKIVEVSGFDKYPIQFKVIEDPEVNALSIFGGYVYVNRGLLDFVKDDDNKLAFVLGHEMGHIASRHMAMAMDKQLWGGLFLTAVLSSIGASEGTFNTVSVGWDMLLKGYSQADELQADRLGVEYMIEAGYDPRGSVGVLEEFIKKGDTSAGLFNLMRTHPPSVKRIEAIKRNYASQIESVENYSCLDLLQKPSLYDESSGTKQTAKGGSLPVTEIKSVKDK